MLTTVRNSSDETLAAIAEEKQIRTTNELFILFSMGSQFDHLIMLALAKLGVFCLVADPASVSADDVRRINPIGIIVSGGPASVHAEPPPFDNAIFDIGIPVLGICLGFQMWAKHIGASVILASKREFGSHDVKIIDAQWPLFAGCGSTTNLFHETLRVLQSHGDFVEPEIVTNLLHVAAWSPNTPVAAAQHDHLFGVQFHPEVPETERGELMFENFCFRICGAKDRYPAADIAQQKIAQLREQIGDRRVLLALSGGSDSSVTAYLLRDALKGKPRALRGVYIKGVDRPDDEAHVITYFGNQDWLEFKIVDATELFLDAVKGKTFMHEKRRGMKFDAYQIVLEREIADYGASLIAQGTLYTDISESGGGYETGARKAVIKEHHNIGLAFSVPELVPLANCVKDGARNIGRTIGVPEALLTRHPFPGPGLLLRIEGEVTRKKLAVSRQVDGIFIEELRAWKLYDTVWQAGAFLTASTHTHTKGDDGGSGSIIMLWAVWSVNGFTARAAELPPDFLAHTARRITDEVREVAAVSYRISGKPPATIEAG